MSELNLKEILSNQDFAMTHIENTYNMCEKDAESLFSTVVECMEEDIKNLPHLYSGFCDNDFKNEFKESCKEAEGYIW